jgi:hypothetical protein
MPPACSRGSRASSCMQVPEQNHTQAAAAARGLTRTRRRRPSRRPRQTPPGRAPAWRCLWGREGGWRGRGEAGRWRMRQRRGRRGARGRHGDGPVAAGLIPWPAGRRGRAPPSLRRRSSTGFTWISLSGMNSMRSALGGGWRGAARGGEGSGGGRGRGSARGRGKRWGWAVMRGRRTARLLRARFGPPGRARAPRALEPVDRLERRRAVVHHDRVHVLPQRDAHREVVAARRDAAELAQAAVHAWGLGGGGGGQGEARSWARSREGRRAAGAGPRAFMPPEEGAPQLSTAPCPTPANPDPPGPHQGSRA